MLAAVAQAQLCGRQLRRRAERLHAGPIHRRVVAKQSRRGRRVVGRLPPPELARVAPVPIRVAEAATDHAVEEGGRRLPPLPILAVDAPAPVGLVGRHEPRLDGPHVVEQVLRAPEHGVAARRRERAIDARAGGGGHSRAAPGVRLPPSPDVGLLYSSDLT
jgi:hypothetical protein